VLDLPVWPRGKKKGGGKRATGAGSGHRAG